MYLEFFFFFCDACRKGLHDTSNEHTHELNKTIAVCIPSYSWAIWDNKMCVHIHVTD